MELFRYLIFGEKDYLRILKGILIRMQNDTGERGLFFDPTEPTKSQEKIDNTGQVGPLLLCLSE